MLWNPRFILISFKRRFRKYKKIITVFIVYVCFYSIDLVAYYQKQFILSRLLCPRIDSSICSSKLQKKIAIRRYLARTLFHYSYLLIFLFLFLFLFSHNFFFFCKIKRRRFLIHNFVNEFNVKCFADTNDSHFKWLWIAMDYAFGFGMDISFLRWLSWSYFI